MFTIMKYLNTDLFKLLSIAMVFAMLIPDIAGAMSGGNKDTAPNTIVLPLLDFHGRPVVDLLIAGQGPYRFILDTGAGVTVIDKGLANKLALDTQGETEIGSPLGGTVPADEVQLTDVKLGELQFGNIRALAMDLAGMLGGGEAPVGVLSSALFSGWSLIFDFPAKEIRLTSELLPPADGKEVFDFCSPEGKPSMTVDVAGISHCAVIDTGSPGNLTLPLSAADKLPLKAPPAVVGRAVLVGAEVKVLGATLDGDLRIGSSIMPGAKLSFIENTPEGNLGQGFFGSVELTIDHQNERIRVRPSTVKGGAENVPQPRRMVRRMGKKRYGIRLRGLDNPDLVVIGVDPGSPAEAGGLLEGDRIVSMNGQVVTKLSTSERISAIKGSPLALRIDRNGKFHELTLDLESPSGS